MSMKPRQSVEQDLPASTWNETRDRHPLDTLLRKHGYRIHSRPRGREPQWEKDGTVLPQSEALKQCPPDEVRAARGDVPEVRLYRKGR